MGAREAGHEVETIDVARLEFPLVRSREDFEHGAVPDAIREAQDVLRRADHVVVIRGRESPWEEGPPARRSVRPARR
jgi:putative NADPH-quinone reductase